ncbi:MAG: iron-sulfur cluster-binding protein [Firmicutes bacterium]|nr:iron-sulfur cluster-binding protein [Bacillota bacterium]
MGEATALPSAFQRRVERALADDFLRMAVPQGTFRDDDARRRAWAELGAAVRWRERARRIREHTVRHLDRYLALAAERIEAQGGRVHWAADAAEAAAAVTAILRAAGARRIVKSKSMVTEEIRLNERLEAEGFEVVETDLGEYILQVAGDRPSHIIAPAMHMTRRQVRAELSRVAGRELPDDAAALVAFARERLREAFLAADAGITGANFVVAEAGAVVLVSNEGNGRMVASLPRVHIAIVGMERLVPRWEDLGVLLELLARSATGQKMSVYTTFAGGVRRPDEIDGPEEFHVIFLDNGRSRLLGTDFQEALHCIRCGACQNACPVYRRIGGHAYGGVYGGPIGAVLMPLLGGDGEDWGELPWASSLCGACHEACPVLIPLPELLLRHRRDEVEAGRVHAAQRWAMRLWGIACAHPAAYRLAARLARLLPRSLVSAALGAWTAGRDLLPLSARPFHARWAAMRTARR